MEVEVRKTVKVKLERVIVCAKVRDSGCYSVVDTNNNEIHTHDGYVPDFFPGEHHGDYLNLDIDLETGKILNWAQPTDEQMQKFFDDNND